MPTPSNPYRVNVRDLVHRPGEMREKQLTFAVPEQLGAAAVVVPEGTELELDLRLEGLHDGILVSADVRTTAFGECVRCLDPVVIPVEVEFQELFAYSQDEAYDYLVHDDHVDCEPVVRDAVVLSLPFQPVCREDCPGLDPETGERLADAGPREPREVIDPRWAVLEGLALEHDESRKHNENTGTTS
ncbi:YceD family protein [Microcella sp.]|uniref:YceD family protein n=1 Tax=Microcella sp. TaxID=1913979 RepID=UPI003F6F8B8E